MSTSKFFFVVAAILVCALTHAQGGKKSIDLPAAPDGEPKAVAQAALRRSKLPCSEMIKADRSPSGHITAICKTPGHSPSHIYKDQTRYRVVGAGKEGRALTCHSSAAEPMFVCK